MRRAYLLIVALFCTGTLATAQRAHLDLNGAWEFRTDPESVGVRQEWHSPTVSFPERLQVPGAWQAQGIGKPQGNLLHNYSGPAWYRRQVSIPASWQGKSIHLRIGGALRATTIYVNGRRAGEHDGFSTPFQFDITQYLKPGAENTIAVRIENPGGDLSSSPDAQVSTQPSGMLNYIGNWGGIYGNVELEAAGGSRIDQVAIEPHIGEQRASLLITLAGELPAGARLEASAGDYRAAIDVSKEKSGPVQLSLPMPGFSPWSPDLPFLYLATVRLTANGREVDRVAQRFGMREITTRGRVLLLNRKPLYLRGYGDDNVEVLTGVPPASKQVILERVRLARLFGFNAVRFHSMIPTEQFFEAADEAGLLVMAELPAAYTMHFLPHRDYLRQELERTLTIHRNHPSFLSLAFGNEFNLNWLGTPAERAEFQSTVQDFYQLAKSIDPNRLILSNDGLLLRPSDMVSMSSGSAPDAPTVRHEFGEYYCSLPDVSLIPKFTGVIKPTWLEAKQRWIAEHGLEAAYPIFLANSKRLQQIGRKFQIERVRRASDVSGYHYWLGTDYPGGTGEGDSWEEGWFDYFWQPKGIEPKDGREINSPVLLMIDSDVDKRTMWNEDATRIGVTVSNYGQLPIRDGRVSWTLTGPGGVVSRGSLNRVNVGLGEVAPAGVIELPPVGTTAAQKLELAAEIDTSAEKFRNHWTFWSFPRTALLASPTAKVVSDVRWSGLGRIYPFIGKRMEMAPPADSLLITQRLDAGALQFLKNGGKVWLMADDSTFPPSPGKGSFFPPSGGAIGSVILDHPALRGFPHDGMFDLQFFHLLQGCWNFPLDSWPQELQPIAGSIRTTSSFLSKSKELSRTGYIFEIGAGGGKLLVSTLRIRENFDEAYPEAIFLFDRLLRYATSNDFSPRISVADEQLKRLIAE